MLEKINADLKDAMRARDDIRKSVLRMVKAAVQNRSIDKKAELSDEEILDVLGKEVKMRRDAIESVPVEKAEVYADFLEQQRQEIGVLEEYLPEQLSKDEVRAMVKEILVENDITQKRQMGQAMGLIMPALKGKADGKLVNKIVMEQLD